MQQLGPRGAAVHAFLDEVRTAERETWLAHVEQPLPPMADQRAAWNAVGEVRLSASVHAAISKESLDAFRATGLGPEDFPGKRARYLAIPSEIELAATVIAAGAGLEDEYAHIILEPFAAGGFTTAKAEFDRRGARASSHGA